MAENTNLEVIGVDIGYGLCKTVHTNFTTSLKDFGETKPPLMDRVIFYKGKYYAVGGDRAKAKADKTEDEDTYILTLAGIGEELKLKGLTKASIVLSVGLPLERCNGETRTGLEQYYSREKEVKFSYEDIEYEITIEKVIVNAQCVSGIIDMLQDKSIPSTCIIVDIGSWTIDILPIENYKPQQARAISLPNGVINCMNSCNNEIRRRTGLEVLESQIQQVMLGNKDALVPMYSTIVQNVIRDYVKDIADTLIEYKYNIHALPCVFMGGGASVVKNYGKDLFPISSYCLDISANAIGYERIAKMLISKQS